ncbi:MAG: hypothetical protein R2865_12500 [Deinococcales bacterium]
MEQVRVSFLRNDGVAASSFLYGITASDYTVDGQVSGPWFDLTPTSGVWQVVRAVKLSSVLKITSTLPATKPRLQLIMAQGKKAFG